LFLSDIPENKECVDENSADFFKRGDVKDLAAKLKFAMENQDFLKELGKNAREQAIDKFEIGSIAKQYEEIYSSLIKQC